MNIKVQRSYSLYNPTDTLMLTVLKFIYKKQNIQIFILDNIYNYKQLFLNKITTL